MRKPAVTAITLARRLPMVSASSFINVDGFWRSGEDASFDQFLFGQNCSQSCDSELVWNIPLSRPLMDALGACPVHVVEMIRLIATILMTSSLTTRKPDQPILAA